jgi:hypothetical protein
LKPGHVFGVVPIRSLSRWFVHESFPDRVEVDGKPAEDLAGGAFYVEHAE